MSEGVEILISADDQASAKLAQVADNVDARVKRIKDVGGKAKASTEFIGTLASSLGGSQLGSYASGLAGLTEKISAFSEVSKSGAAGALAFKAGLVAVVAAGAYKVGEAIGNAVFETKRWQEELAKATIESQRLDAALLKMSGRKFDQQKFEIELMDPDAQLGATKEMLAAIEKEIIGKQKQISDKLSAEEDFNTAWFGTPEDRAKAKDTSALDAQLALLREQRDGLQLATSERTLENEQIKKANDLKAKNQSYIDGLGQEVQLLKAARDEEAAIAALKDGKGSEQAALDATAKRIALEASQKTGGDAGAMARAEILLKEKDGIVKKQEAEKLAAETAKKASEKAVQDAEKLADMKKKELDKLKEQEILLTQGKEAARAFALEQQGLDKTFAEGIASREAGLDKIAKDSEKQDPQQATQGRLLTRGPSDDIRKKQLDAALKAVDALRKIEANSVAWKSKTELVIESVGRS